MECPKCGERLTGMGKDSYRCYECGIIIVPKTEVETDKDKLIKEGVIKY